MQPNSRNKRAGQRPITLLPGVVVGKDGQGSFDCAINNLTASGARLTVPRSARFAKRFYLINLRDCTAHEASVAWHTDNTAGVRYHKSMSVGPGLPPTLHFLKALCLQRVVR